MGQAHYQHQLLSVCLQEGAFVMVERHNQLWTNMSSSRTITVFGFSGVSLISLRTFLKSNKSAKNMLSLVGKF